MAVDTDRQMIKRTKRRAPIMPKDAYMDGLKKFYKYVLDQKDDKITSSDAIKFLKIVQDSDKLKGLRDATEEETTSVLNSLSSLKLVNKQQAGDDRVLISDAGFYYIIQNNIPNKGRAWCQYYSQILDRKTKDVRFTFMIIDTEVSVVATRMAQLLMSNIEHKLTPRLIVDMLELVYSLMSRSGAKGSSDTVKWRQSQLLSLKVIMDEIETEEGQPSLEDTQVQSGRDGVILTNDYAIICMIDSLIRGDSDAKNNINESEKKRYATAFTDKKHISKRAQKFMESNYLIDQGVQHTEFDSDTKYGMFYQLNSMLGVVYPLLPKTFSDYTFRVRKLGNHNARGIYLFGEKQLVVDYSNSFIHEYGHMFDDSSRSLFPENADAVRGSSIKGQKHLSTSDTFKDILKFERKQIKKAVEEGYRIDSYTVKYLSEPEEVFTRAFISYLRIKGLNTILEPHAFNNLNFEQFNEVLKGNIHIFDSDPGFHYIEDYVSYMTLLGDKNQRKRIVEFFDEYINNPLLTSIGLPEQYRVYGNPEFLSDDVEGILNTIRETNDIMRLIHLNSDMIEEIADSNQDIKPEVRINYTIDFTPDQLEDRRFKLLQDKVLIMDATRDILGVRKFSLNFSSMGVPYLIPDSYNGTSDAITAAYENALANNIPLETLTAQILDYSNRAKSTIKDNKVEITATKSASAPV